MIKIYLKKHYPRCFLLLFLTICSFTSALGQINLQNGLLACYAFNGNAKDGSGNGNNGTVNGATLTTDRFGNANSAYNFDGATNYIEIPSTQFKNNIYTFSVWVNTAIIPGINEYTYPFSIGGGGGDQSLDLSNGANGAKGWTFGGYSIGSPTVPFCHVGSLPVVNTWYHLVGIRDNSTMKLFVNGQLISTANTNGFNPSYGTGTTAMIGARATLVQKFKGKVDDIRIYNRAITAAEVTELYTNPPPCEPAPDLQQGLLACYAFSGNANDGSGNGNNGTVNGATLTTDRFGNANSAYNFDGINDHINISPSNLLNNNYTYSLWGKASSIPAVQSAGVLFSVGESGGDQGISLNNVYLGSNVSLGWVGGGINQNGLYTSAVSGSLPNVNSWYHITVTRTNLSASLFVNGQLISTVLSNGFLPLYTINGAKGRIGIRSNAIQPFNGSIDDIRIYNRALSAEEVSLLYKAPNVGSMSIQATNTDPCAETEVSFTALPSAGSDAKYQWKVDGINQGNLNASSSFAYTFPNKSQAYTATVSTEVSSESTCISAFAQTTIAVNPVLIPSVTLSSDKSNPCEGADVLFTALPTNGGLSPLYQWKIDGVNQGALSSSPTFSHVFTTSAQAYTAKVSVVMTSNAVCALPSQATAQTTVAIEPTSLPSVTVAASNSKPCAGEIIKFTATHTNGGSAPLYQWSVDGVKRGSTSSDSAIFITFPNAAQPYSATVSVEMITTCASAKHGIDQITLMVQPLVIPTISINASDPISCTNTSTTFTATPSLAGAIYQWKINEVNQGMPTTTSSFLYTFPSIPSAYTIGVDVSFPAAACLLPTSAKKTVQVADPSLLQVALSVNDQEICAGQTSTFWVYPVVAGATYQWKIDDIAQGSLSPEPAFFTIFTEKAQSYDARVSVDIFPNQRCVAAISKEIKVTINPNPVLTCIFPETAENGNLTKYAVKASGGLPPYHYRWTLGNDTIHLGGNDAINYAFTKNGVFEMEVQVTDSKGCETTCQSTIRSLFFPNVFTPNGDKENDTFSVRYAGNDFEMQVFNRWGKLVCLTNDGMYGWDGQGVPSGLYFYQIKIASKEYKGWVSLLR